MERITTILIADLVDLIAALGRDQGQISPSIYDSAQLLRFAPPTNPNPAVAWIFEQQHSDGGWGDPAVPKGRDAATFAAVLGLRLHARRARDHEAIATAVRFLRRQIGLWREPGDDIPLATELLLPWLVADAQAQGFACNVADYAALAALGEQRRDLIACFKPAAATPPVHSWEAWGDHPDRSVVDLSGGIGHSPAATAAWLRMTANTPGLEDARSAAGDYLSRAARVTGVGIEGIVPTVWPYGRNEQIVSIYTLLLAGLLDEPALRRDLETQIADLRHALRPDGYGISDLFRCDGDLTAMAFAVLHHFGDRPNVAILRRYLVEESVGQSCLTYPQELQRSRSATAHAAHALALLGEDAMPPARYLLHRRDQDGRMIGEKWHTAWLYLTGHAMHTFIACDMPGAACGALDAILAYQHADGGWGIAGTTAEETAYGALALLALARHDLLPEAAQVALHGAGRWLLANYRPFAEDPTARWTAKQLYRPRRIARVEEVGATLACVLGGWGVAS